jgi:hypothetical protein
MAFDQQRLRHCVLRQFHTSRKLSFHSPGSQIVNLSESNALGGGNDRIKNRILFIFDDPSIVAECTYPEILGFTAPTLLEQVGVF